MTAKEKTIDAIKKFFKKIKDLKDAIDGFLTAAKWVLTISGLVYTWYSTKAIMNKNTEIQHKNDTLRVKTDSMRIAKNVCSKAMDDNQDTAIKYKKIAKVLYVKPKEVHLISLDTTKR